MAMFKDALGIGDPTTWIGNDSGGIIKMVIIVRKPSGYKERSTKFLKHKEVLSMKIPKSDEFSVGVFLEEKAAAQGWSANPAAQLRSSGGKGSLMVRRMGKDYEIALLGGAENFRDGKWQLRT